MSDLVGHPEDRFSQNEVHILHGRITMLIIHRVVNVSSRGSHSSARKCSDALKAKFSSPNDITVPEVEQLMTEFVR